MGFFDAFRTGGFPTMYPPNKTPVRADVLEAGLFYALGILALSFLLIIPGIRHKQVINRYSFLFDTIIEMNVNIC